ncbi:MAG: amidohydrolase family protein [Bacteroidetes bacterium]|nr:amidohydrolase family protein [Bacteroidota bacterium]MBS1540585.1 amidohydrolase family protein [Bacteroidota bacterium]
MYRLFICFCFFFFLFLSSANSQAVYFITADRVFDGENLHTNWAVVISGDKITAVGPVQQVAVPPQAIKVNYPNSTLLPGLIEAHTHLFLYPYNITNWDMQVLKETDSYRTIRATVHAKNTLMAGFTTARDLGTEGAGYSDVALKQAIQAGIIPGPRLIVAGRAIVATGTYGPKGYDHDQQIMLGAETADGNDLIRVTRDQIGKGADVVKVYADYRWGKENESMPTFSIEELSLIVETAKSSGRAVVAHASTAEGMRRAVMAGVETIEHGDGGTPEVFNLMKSKNVALCPTLAATESISKYKGWRKGIDPDPEAVKKHKTSFKSAIESGVTILVGGDVGVFAHGENVLEMELLVEYGLSPLNTLKAATQVNARALHLNSQVGSLKEGWMGDVVIVSGDPTKNISDLRNIKFVMKEGIVYRHEK